MRWIDDTYVRLWPRRPVFEEGWGDALTLERGLDPSLREVEPEPAAIRWTRSRTHGRAKVTEGLLTSPDAELPAESRVGRMPGGENR